MKCQLKNFFFPGSLLAVVLIMAILVECDSQSRSNENEISSKIKIRRFFTDDGVFEPLIEYQKGGWFMIEATFAEVDKFLMDKDFRNVIRFNEESNESCNFSNFTQFAVPEGIDSELNGKYLRFRGNYGEFEVKGVYEYRNKKLVICYYSL